MQHLRRIFGGLLVLAALTLSACGGSDEHGSPAASSGGSAAESRASAPESLKDGVLNVYADGAYPPYAYLDKDGKTMLGMETELLDALGEKLGVKTRYHSIKFDAMIPAIANGRADLMIMGMADTAERRKQVDFIDLYKTTMRVVAQKGNPANLSLGDDPAAPQLENLCGKTVAVATGGQQEQTAKVLDANCKRAGKPGLKSLVFSVATQEYLAVKTRRADFSLMVPANADFFVKANPAYEIVPGSFPTPGARFTGWILAKDNGALQDRLLQAINELIDDGTWTKILAKWGVSETDAVVPPLRNGRPANVS